MYHKSEKNCGLFLIFMDYCRDIQILCLFWFGMGLFLWISLSAIRSGVVKNKTKISVVRRTFGISISELRTSNFLDD